jgi:Protein of unknown function (DUF2795)
MPTKSPASLQQFLRDATFPMAKDELVRNGRETGLTPDMVSMLERLPDETYMTAVDVSLAVSELDADSTSSRSRSTASRSGVQSRKSTSKPETGKGPVEQSSAREKRPPQPVMAPNPAKTEMTGATSRIATRVTGIARDQLESRKGQASMQLEQAAQSVRQSGEQFRQQGNPMLADVSEVAASGLEQANEFLRTRDIDAVIREAEATARRQPALVIGGGFAIAFLVTRLLKAGVSEPRPDDRPKNQNER